MLREKQKKACLNRGKGNYRKLVQKQSLILFITKSTLHNRVYICKSRVTVKTPLDKKYCKHHNNLNCFLMSVNCYFINHCEYKTLHYDCLIKHYFANPIIDLNYR